jgi:hypothetical protein
VRSRLVAGIVAAALLSGLLVAVPAVVSSVAADPLAGTVTASEIFDQLDVAAPVSSGYDRSLFNLWIDADNDGCDTRQEVLIRQSLVPVTYSSGCTITAGQWFSWYDGQTWTGPSDVDIDHFVPLGEAWQSGANAWTATQREAYANDLDFLPGLVAVTDNVNQSKGDRDPAQWMPSDPSVQCTYAVDWVEVKYRWSLTIDTAEASALSSLLAGSCGNTQVTAPTVMVTGVTTTPVTAPTSSPVYRFWSPSLHAHFYTIDAAEKAQIVATYPPSVWTYEGIGYGAFINQANGTIPLYRFWSNRLGDHFYTTSASERDSIIRTYDTNTWLYEGVAYYVYPQSSTVANTVSVARFWSPDLQTHFYTADDAERDSIIRTYPARTWTYEDQEFRVPAGSTSVTPPVSTPPVVTPPVGTPPANPGDSKNCGDFSTYAQAKAWFDTYYPYYGDVARLDGNNDLIPCESLPGHP